MMTPLLKSRACGWAFLWLMAAWPAVAQSHLPLRDHPHVKAAFREAVRRAQGSVCRVECDGKDVALGTVVGTDGWILTKASELKGDAVCWLGERQYPAQVVGIHEEYDLALLKIDAADLLPVAWHVEAQFHPGQWLVTAGQDEEPLAIGVLSVAPRPIPAGAMLGIQMGDNPRGPEVVRVLPDSGAAKAGLVAGDVITQIQDKPVRTREELIENIRRCIVGKTVKLKVLRGEEELEIRATLGKSEVHFQDKLGGALSDRASGFPRALQHDTVLRPRHCGGPLLDLDGHAVGLNIARAGRVASYAIPAADVAAVLEELKSRKLAPESPMPQAVKVESKNGS